MGADKVCNLGVIGDIKCNSSQVLMHRTCGNLGVGNAGRGDRPALV